VKVTTEHTPDCSAVVTVEVDEQQVNEAMRTAAKRISRVRPMPGFRPGKAPYALVERTVGKEVLRDEAVQDLAQTVYKQVLKDEKINAYDAGKLEVPQQEPLVLKFTIPTRPVVKLGDYHSIHLRPREVTVTDEEIDKVLERFQSQQAQMVPVTRPVQMDDLLTINLEGRIDGQEPTKNEGLQVRMEKDKPVFPWIEQLVGANINEPRTVSYTYPADETNSELAGKTATYTVTVTDIKEPHLPPIDDELAKAVSQYENLDQLKRSVRSTLLAQKQSDEESRFADEAVDAVVEQSEISYPALMLDDEINQDIERTKDFATRLGMAWNKYLELSGKTEEQLREETRPRAEKRLKRLLVLLEWIDAEKIEVSSKEIDVEIDRRAEAAARNGGRADQTRRSLSNPESRRDIEFALKINKAVNRLVAMVKGEPTSGKILTPEMVRAELQAQAEQAASKTTPAPGALITDPSQVRAEDWPHGLDRPLIPGQDE
jgi:trigger factor